MSRPRATTPVTSITVLVFALALVGAVLSACDRAPSAAPAGPPSTVAILADYPFYSSAGELADMADAIVVGMVAAAETRQIDVSMEGDPVGDPYLVAEVTVEQVIKGGLQPRDTIEVKQLLSADSPQRIWLDREGMRAVLFLAEFPGLPHSPLSPIQGVVSIDGGKTRPAPGNSLFETLQTEEELLSELRALVD